MAKIKTKAIQIDSVMHSALVLALTAAKTQKVQMDVGGKVPTLRELVEHALHQVYDGSLKLRELMASVQRQEAVAGNGDELLPGAGVPLVAGEAGAYENVPMPQQESLPVTDEMKTEMFNGILRLAFGGEYEAAEHIEYEGVSLTALADFMAQKMPSVTSLDDLFSAYDDACANLSYP